MSIMRSGGVFPCKVFDSTLSGSASTLDTGASGIPAGWDLLQIFAILRTDEAVVGSTVAVTINADTGASYDWQFIRGDNATASAGNGLAQTSLQVVVAGASCTSGVFSHLRYTFPFYTQTTAQKCGELTHTRTDVTVGNRRAELQGLNWRSTAAITRFTMTAAAGKNFIAGSRLTIWGH